ESRKLLQTSFPVNIVAESAAYDIQYGFVRRPMHSNTSRDFAKFEMPAHRYTDISDYEKGVALLNDCKYASTVRNSVMTLSLLRATKYPDYFADQGAHEFTYSLLPHQGCLEESTVMAQSACLNRRPVIFDRYEAVGLQAPVIGLDGEGISLEVIKKAEKKAAIVLRFVETRGRNSTAKVALRQAADLAETDLLEWDEKEVAANITDFKLTLAPFEIKSYLLRFRPKANPAVTK
ncbi:MAG: glycoside hydrolase family 38 C-terminal domain-containing protein, partial [Victivallaceae bacterium]|nr:glycoside hydrolase family 38 C-terminal domain-containing protein [Victivallaceae bacterium]